MALADDPAVLINQFIAAAASDGDTAVFAAELASLLRQKSLSLLQFIQVLGPIITSESVAARSHSVHCLAATLAALVGSAPFSVQDVVVLLKFLLSKLEDEKLSAHILNALASLVQFKAFRPNANDSLVSLLKDVATHYEPRKHLARVRFEAFNLLEAVFSKHHDEISTVPVNADAFVEAFIHVASGEKDPRNLLLSFKLNRAINERLSFDARTANATHDQQLTDLFDVCFCYFPISFTPPPNDPYKITAAELKLELRKTIASQSQFAQDTFPSLFEKLTSSNPAVRNDVLLCLCLCIENYTSITLEQYWVTIWDALKFEILHNDALIFRPEASYIIPPSGDSLEDTDDNKIIISTLCALSSLATRLAETDSFKAFLATTLGDLKPNLKGIGEKKSKQSVVLVCALGSSSRIYFDELIDALFSFELWGKYIRSDTPEDTQMEDTETDVSLTISRQRDLIDSLGFVLSAYGILDAPNNLNAYKDHLLVFLGQLLQASSTLEKTLKCKITQQLVKMVLLKNFLSSEDVTLILTWLAQSVKSIIENSQQDDWLSDILLKEIVKGLVFVMSEGSEDSLNKNVLAVIETILPYFLERSYESAVLSIINQLCVNYQFLEVLSIRFLNKMAYDDYDAEVFGNIIECLTTSFVQTQAVKPFLTNSWHEKFIPRFLATVFKKCGEDAVILELAGQLCGYIIRFIDKAKHQQILDDYTSLFLMNGEYEKMKVQSILEHPTHKVTVYKHMVAKIDKNTKLQQIGAQELVKGIIEIVRDTDDEVTRLGYLQLLALTVNKFMPANDVFNDELLKSLFAESSSLPRSLEVAIWVEKGLIVKTDPIGSKYLDIIVQNLTEEENIEYCKSLSKSFTVLMSDLAIFTNPENKKNKIISGVVNLNAKLLYKQQVFESLLQKLLSNFAENKNEARREVCLTTLATIINNVSPNILKAHLQEVLPLVLNGLALQNTSVLEASLQTFKVIIHESPDLILENLASLLDKLVHLSTDRIVVGRKLVNDESIRLLSLECILGIFDKIDFPKVVRYQGSTRHKLAVALDDKKRSVRKKATDVRQALYELGR